MQWSVAPGPEACEANATRPDWPWRVPSRSWAVTYRTRAYALVASRSGTVRSLAGLRLGGRPNVAGEGGAIPSVMAHVGDGEVTGFEAWIGGAGD